MLKKTITYEDFNGNELTEDFYFNLSSPEATRMSAKFGADISNYAEQLAASNDMAAMIDFMETIILDSYGEKSLDGKQFMKSPEIRQKFEYSNAYAALFEELLLDPSKATEFGEALATSAKPNKQNKELLELARKREQERNHKNEQEQE